jgi:iron complex transport system ATP-binding protein
MSQVTAKELQIVFGLRRIINIAEFSLHAGELVAIIGPNGAGKSTLLRALAGDLKPWSGTVTYGDDPLHTLHPKDLAGRRAVLSQSIHVTFPFTVFEVVRLGMMGAAHGVERNAAQNLPSLALARVDLAGFEHRLYGELSGGEQQRVQLARVLCQIWQPVVDDQPRFLFLDEPSASLDIRHQLMVLDIALDYARAGGGVLAILHDLNLAATYADRLVVMDQGEIVADGPPVKTLTTQIVSRVFGVNLPVGLAPPKNLPFVLPQTLVAPGPGSPQI